MVIERILTCTIPILFHHRFHSNRVNGNLIYSISRVLYNHVICSVCRNHNPVLSSFMTYHRETWWVPHVDQELLSLPEHMSTLIVSGVRVARSLVTVKCFVDHCLSFCTFLINPLVSSNFSFICFLLSCLIYVYYNKLTYHAII